MFSTKIKFFAILLLLSVVVCSQSNDRFLPDKPGKWSVVSNLQNLSKSEKIEFEKNLNAVTEWFHKSVPLLANPKGYDLEANFMECGMMNTKQETIIMLIDAKWILHFSCLL